MSKFKKGDIVKLKPEIEVEWEKDGEFNYGGWILRGIHEVREYLGGTLYMTDGCGFSSGDEVLELVGVSKN